MLLELLRSIVLEEIRTTTLRRYTKLRVRRIEIIVTTKTRTIATRETTETIETIIKILVE